MAIKDGYSYALSITRTADTNAYTANDVIGTSVSAGGAVLTFPAVGIQNSDMMITSVQLQINDTAVISGETNYRLHLYSSSPPSALVDNNPFDVPVGDRAAYLGYVDIGTPIDLGSTLYIEQNNIGKQIRMVGTSLFGYLVTIGAYTPTSARVFVLTVHAASI